MGRLGFGEGDGRVFRLHLLLFHDSGGERWILDTRVPSRVPIVARLDANVAPPSQQHRDETRGLRASEGAWILDFTMTSTTYGAETRLGNRAQN